MKSHRQLKQLKRLHQRSKKSNLRLTKALPSGRSTKIRLRTSQKLTQTSSFQTVAGCAASVRITTLRDGPSAIAATKTNRKAISMESPNTFLNAAAKKTSQSPNYHSNQPPSRKATKSTVALKSLAGTSTLPT